MNYTINLDLQEYVNKQGELPLRFRISINGKHGYIKLGKHIKASAFDRKEKIIKKGVTGYGQINTYLRKQKAIIDKIFSEAELQGDLFTHKQLRELYRTYTGKTIPLDFYDYVQEVIEYEKQYSKVSKNTLSLYEYQNKLIKSYAPNLKVHEIDKQFIEGLVKYVREDARTAKGNRYSETGIYRVLIFLRKYSRKLFKDGHIKKYPFDDYTVGKVPETRFEFLLPEELNKLHDLYDSQELKKIIQKNDKKFTNVHKKDYPIGLSMQNVLRYYLASCYTGLRHSDIKRLSTDHIKDGYIVIKMKKGRLGKRKTVRIPIRKRLLSLMEINASDGLVFEDVVFENSHTNKLLKLIMEIAGIKKNMTFHTARHTFATVSLMLGLKIETVSDILGHAEISTTQRYAHIIDELRDSEMDNWDKLSKDEFVKSDSKEHVICPSCESLVFAFEKDTIKLKKFPVECSSCGNEFFYKVGKVKKVVNMKIVN